MLAPKSLPFLLPPKVTIGKLHVPHVHFVWRTAGVAVAALAGLFFIVNVLMAAGQYGRVPIFTKVGGVNLGLMTSSRATAALTDHVANKQLVLTIDGQQFAVNPEQAGVALDTKATLQAATNPQGWDKLPLINAVHRVNSPVKPHYTVDEAKLEKYLAGLTVAQTKAQNAAIVIPDDASKPAYIVPEVAGSHFDPAQAARTISQKVRQNGTLTLTLSLQPVSPAVSSAQLSDRLAHANTLLSARLTLLNGQKQYALSAGDVRSIIVVQPDDTGFPMAGVDRDRVVSLLKNVGGKFYQAPVAQQVTLHDGVSVGSSGGANGVALDTSKTADGVVAAIYDGRTTLEVTLATVKPTAYYTKTYSHTSAGLLAYIKDYAANHAGSYLVATMELTGSRSAYFNANTSIVPASTYKLFLAYVALHKIEQGQLSGSDQTSAGSVTYCIQQMIVVSDNTCAVALLNYIGWAEVDVVIHAAGFSQTMLNNSGGGYMATTPSNLVGLLTGLYNRTLLNGDNTDYLLGLMKQQVYRSGIPAGSNGAPVADKVGFLYSWNHDAGIVYAPGVTYILVVMTTNSSFASIAALSSGLYTLYN